MKIPHENEVVEFIFVPIHSHIVLSQSLDRSFSINSILSCYFIVPLSVSSQSLVLNGTTDSETLFAGTSSEVHGLAVDWLSRNLYFSDALYDWIILITIDPGKHFYKIIVNDQLDSPHGLAVDPIHG